MEAVVLVEYSRLGHAVVVVDGEATSDLHPDFSVCLHSSSDTFAQRISVRELPASHPGADRFPERHDYVP